MTAKTMSQCLNKAADLIEKEGWGQGVFYERSYGPGSPKGNFCMMGACMEVCSNIPLRTFATALGFTAEDVLYKYNDRRNQKKGAVVARLRKYAARAEKAERGA